MFALSAKMLYFYNHWILNNNFLVITHILIYILQRDLNQCVTNVQNKIYIRNVPDNRLRYPEQKTDIDVDYSKANRNSG